MHYAARAWHRLARPRSSRALSPAALRSSVGGSGVGSSGSSASTGRFRVRRSRGGVFSLPSAGAVEEEDLCTWRARIQMGRPTHPPSAPHPGTDTTLKPRQRPRPSPPASCVRPHVDGLCAGLTGPAAGAGECGNRWRGANLSGIREASPRPLRYPALRRRPRGTASAPYETRKRNWKTAGGAWPEKSLWGRGRPEAA